MNKILIIFYFLLIFPFSHCDEIEFKEIDSLEKTEFNINKNISAYFKYKVEGRKGPIGIHFHIANLYTVQVLVYKSLEEGPITNYFLAEKQFKEIDTEDFDDYVYIEIKETYEYFYKDYITIYNPNEIIELKSEEPLTINNFLSNNIYKFHFSSKENTIVLYNTLNNGKNKRKITVQYDNQKIVDDLDDSFYKENFNPGNLTITVKNVVEDEEETLNQDFSLIIYEQKNPYGFKKIIQNEIIKTKYIYNNENQTFYYYADITDMENSNTMNFKLYFKYYLFNNNTNFYTNIISLDNEITKSDFEKNIPNENKLQMAYDEDTDEYFRIYFHIKKDEGKFIYLLVKLEIIENEYYIGLRDIETSLGNEVENIDLTQEAYNEAYEIDKKIVNYIPTYFKLVLDSNEKYLFTYENPELTLFLIGDLLDENNEINKNYLSNTNEIIILSDIKEFTVRLFGSSTKNIRFYVEKINKKNFMSAENKRNNQIFEIKLGENECNDENIKYILGTYDYDKYAYGDNSINYYATVDSGEFEVYFKNNINIEGKSLFPFNKDELRKIDEIIVLNKSTDLFTIKCKAPGMMSIRPESKSFDVRTHKIAQNSMNQILLYDHSEIMQLSTDLGQKKGIVYFSILSLEGAKLIIIPDTKGVFQEQTIQNNELFTASADLSKYKMDQLAIRVNCSLLEKQLEITEIIHNKYNTYIKLKKGENQKLNLNNAYIQINNKINQLNITLENLKDKNVSYGVVKTASNDDNYLLRANNYPNITIEVIKENTKKIEIENIYFNSTDNMKPYLYLLISVLGEEENLEYNVNIEIPEGEDEEDKDKEKDNDDHVVLIVFIALIAAIVIGFVTLAIYMCIVKKRAINIEDDSKIEKLYSQNQHSEVDP